MWKCAFWGQRADQSVWMRGVHQVIVSHIEEHSRKPQEVHNRIIRLMGDVPRIELFARRKTDGFDVWGNEVESDIELGGSKSAI